MTGWQKWQMDSIKGKAQKLIGSSKIVTLANDVKLMCISFCTSVKRGGYLKKS